MHVVNHMTSIEPKVVFTHSISGKTHVLTLCKLRNKIEALEKRLLEGAENDEHSSLSARGMQTPIWSACRLL